MNKDVLISITGLQYEIDAEEPVEVICVGEYYKRNEKHYLRYDEIPEDHEGVTSCTMKIWNNQVDLMKRGATNVHMTFEEGQKSTTMYHTPFGDMQVGILTNKVELKEEEDNITIEIHYGLDINFSHISECTIKIKVTQRKVA